MNRSEQFDPGMADAKEFQVPNNPKGAKAFLCSPQPCAKPCKCTPCKPAPCKPPCSPCVGLSRQ